MPKYTTNFDFRGVKENRMFYAGESFELTEERAKEIENTIKKKEPKFKLTPIKPAKKKTKKD